MVEKASIEIPVSTRSKKGMQGSDQRSKEKIMKKSILEEQ